MQEKQRLPPSWFVDIRLKFRHLQLLQALSRHNTLQSAAESLGLAQPAASRLLGDLEDVIGIPLFQREGRRLVINAYGSVLTRHANNLLDELDRTRDEFNALLSGGAGNVSIGAIDGPVVDLLTTAVLNIQRDNPGISLEIRTGSSIGLFHDLMNGDIDIMIGRPPEDTRSMACHYTPIGEEPMVIAARQNHPLFRKTTPVRLEDMVPFPWILQRKGGKSRSRLESIFQDRNLPLPKDIIGSDSLVMTLAYLEKTDALTVLSAAVANQQAKYRQIQIVSSDVNIAISSYGILMLKSRNQSRPTMTVLDELEKTLRPAIGD
ncbi:LysR family transcriptional regulator [Gluconobacter cerevisiae]|uniref:LysR family transcriptional regulator n=1 Tax=Gluconobacter cerevisiae TaxID=1379734 RepID=A0ABR9YCS9_9PROT|nr:LysR substrate-binding domain-containing protein [Gluconobacter cerevisiae]MBF0876460.1 LysR family transcriptional regulator [Gluconobacter cerevisiae]